MAKGTEPRVADVMNPDIVKVTPQTSVVAAAALMSRHDIGCVLVMSDDRVTGIVTDRDIVVRALPSGRAPAAIPVADICTPDVLTIYPDASLDDAEAMMRSHAVRRLPVVGIEGLAVGLVSLGDLAQADDPRTALAAISAEQPDR
jgi:CBS domain-containing protein